MSPVETRVATAAITVVGWVFLVATPVRAQDVRVGYQLGALQSVGTTITNNQDQLAQPQQLVPVDPGAPPVAVPVQTGTVTQRLQGVQLTTNVTANVTFDIVTRTVDHGFVLGAGFTQLLPTAVPPEAIATLRDRITTLQATAQYLARIELATWGLALGGGYNFGSNGRLGTTADGAVQGGGVGQTLPGTQVSAFVVNGVTHTATGNAQFQLTRQRWDFVLQGVYTYTNNGIFNLAPGAPGQQQLPNALGTNIGAFVRATTHTISPGATYRTRVGRQGNINANVQSAYTIPLPNPDQMVTTGTTTVVVPAALPIPRTLTTNGALAYVHNLNQDRSIGLQANGVLNFRVATDPISQTPLQDGAPSIDTLITALRATYVDVLPWELRVTLSVGAAQAHLFQAPLGTFVPFNAEFDPVRSNWEPVFALTLQRFFDPINVTLGLARDIGAGAFGASAIVNENATLALAYQFDVGDRVAQLGVGFNVNQTRAAGRDLFDTGVAAPPPCDPTALPQGQMCPAVNALVVAFNNRGAGANVALGAPIFAAGDFTLQAAAAYNLNFLDPDPDNEQMQPDGTLGRPSFTTHTALFTLGGTFGRGPLQQAATGARETNTLDAFSESPRDGTSLTTSRLIRSGAPLLDNARGARPGEAPPERRDSRQVYERSRRQEQIEREAKTRTDIVQSSGTIQDEERSAQRREEEEREARQKKRTRTFSEWPMNATPLPDEKASPPNQESPPR